MTVAERKLWQVIRRRSLDGYRFRRQVPLGPYIVDFCCLELGLVVEADGSQHFESTRDERRDAWLRARGFTVVRVWNNEILRNLEGVWLTIREAVAVQAKAMQANSSNQPPP